MEKYTWKSDLSKVKELTTMWISEGGLPSDIRGNRQHQGPEIMCIELRGNRLAWQSSEWQRQQEGRLWKSRGQIVGQPTACSLSALIVTICMFSYLRAKVSSLRRVRKYGQREDGAHEEQKEMWLGALQEIRG